MAEPDVLRKRGRGTLGNSTLRLVPRRGTEPKAIREENNATTGSVRHGQVHGTKKLAYLKELVFMARKPSLIAL